MTVRRNSGSEEEYVVEKIVEKLSMIGTKFAIRKQHARRAQLKLVFRGNALFSKICNDLLEKNPHGK